MKPMIVILDEHLINGGSFSWDGFRSLGTCEIYDRTLPSQVIERCKNSEIVITNKVVFSKDVIQALPKLKYIGVTATGYNNVDLVAAKERGIVITNVPSYSSAFVAQHAFALLLNVTNQVALHNQAVQSGEWEKCPDFSFAKTPLIELDQMTFGIIGYGEIGRAVAKIAQGFGLKVIAYSRSQNDPNVRYVDLNTLFKESDVISLHCPLTEETRHLINHKSLNLMKPSAILINTSRGPLIDENALANALIHHKIFAAALDVLDKEPPQSDCPLLRIENCFITPHIGWASFSARKRLFDTVESNLKCYLLGKPRNIV